MTAALDKQLLAAHAAGATERLVDLYGQAADLAPCPDQAAFYLTHAHIFALEIGHPDTNRLRRRLIDAGRETPL